MIFLFLQQNSFHQKSPLALQKKEHNVIAGSFAACESIFKYQCCNQLIKTKLTI